MHTICEILFTIINTDNIFGYLSGERCRCVAFIAS